MILEENRTASYIRSLYTGNTELLDTIEQEALRDYVPIIRVETQSLLKLLLKQKKPRRILELGTAVGFSALLMCEYAPSDCHVTTIENYEKRIPVAKHNFERAGKCDQITLLEGDAMEIIKTLDGPYDFIFVDAAKAQYIHYFPELMRLLEQDGYLVSDPVPFCSGEKKPDNPCPDERIPVRTDSQSGTDNFHSSGRRWSGSFCER